MDNELTFENILVINFGQMGDLILSLPALDAIRRHLSGSRITLLTGRPGSEIVRAANVSDDQIVVDRVEMRDGKKIRSVSEIIRLIISIRGRKFDLIIDLHSLSETNLLGFISGAKHRLYANRESRSLDRLGTFSPKPPKEDKSKHHTDRYFDVLKPLGIRRPLENYTLELSADVRGAVKSRFVRDGLTSRRIIGFSIGAGHPSRCWDLAKFARLSKKILAHPGINIVVFLGPEERTVADRVRESFPKDVVIIDDLSILELAAAMSMLDLLVSNDSGPAHIAGIADCPIVLVMDRRAPLTFLPLSRQTTLVNNSELSLITVDQVFEPVGHLLGHSVEE